MKATPTPTRRLSVFFVSIGVFIALTLILVALVMRPPSADLSYLALLLSVTGTASAVMGFISQRMGWWRRVRSINLALALGYLLAAALTILNVWLTAELMFINQHDLALGTLLLLFAGGISVAFGLFISSSITESLRELVRGAQDVSEGDFSVRVPVSGRDEVAQVATAFNEMIAQLEQMDQAEKALQQARRNLLSGASHDLRTPLASIRAMVDALADGVVSDELTTTRYLHQTQTEIARMSALIDNLFELAQLDIGTVEIQGESASLSDMISDTLQAFAARAQVKTITLTGDAGTDIDPVWMDSAQINRVLNNLLDNALRHTPAGGTITLTAERDAARVRVQVRDTGEGVSPDDLPHIFNYFYRGEQSRSRDGFAQGGAGLGLATVKNIVEAHGGEIWAKSGVGEGATFTFTLPR
jgi:signal transduction histidine kinase